MKLPILSGREVLHAFERLGFAEVDRFTLKGALHDAGVDLRQFLDALR